MRDVLCFALGGLGVVLLGAADPYARLDTLARVLSDIEAQYERPLSLAALVDAALHGAGSSLDDHSAYFTAEEWQERLAQDEGVLVGAGSTLAAEACGLRVISVTPFGPAAKSGLNAGECIVAVDGNKTDAATPVTALDGLEGTAVRVQVSGEGGLRELAILRGRTAEPAVSTKMLDGLVLVVQIRNFADPVTALFGEQLRAAGKVKGLILDLRGNPGGRVEEAALLADRFLSTGVIVTTKRRVGGDVTSSATAAADDLAMPLAVLIDADSASAAEILAGALRDSARAKLVGRTSYGKGSVQRQFIYEDGSALKLTVGRYYLPSGTPILDHQGLVPDVIVPAAIVDGVDQDIAAALRLVTPDRP